ncbi:tail fiber assembly protein [Pantoea dispersa]|uniref:tail fiber assembly protein n=1 Tax=Pantoea dispersa TaxID=59814 RepID=UPI002DBE7AEC|nr:tail fiber assembly protein [Pantoea dispersa]MEB5837009.1 tail fiber assembly protein [Pantoea dispersa]
MGTYALILDGKVINTILWAGPDVAPMEFGDGITYAEIPDGDDNYPSTGWLYDGKSYLAPPLSDEEKDNQALQLIANNTSTKQELMDEATAKISVLQDAVDLEMATDEESKELPLWKKYRVLLSRIDVSKPIQISWPDKP